MPDLARAVATVKLVGGVLVPLLVLSFALGRVDPGLLAGAVVTFGGVFGLVYAYARYVDIGSETDEHRQPSKD